MSRRPIRVGGFSTSTHREPRVLLNLAVTVAVHVSALLGLTV